VTKGLLDISDQIKRGNRKLPAKPFAPPSSRLRVRNQLADNFAKPLSPSAIKSIPEDATVSDLQIFYLQKDPSSWLTKSSMVLDQSNAEYQQVPRRNHQVAAA